MNEDILAAYESAKAAMQEAAQRLEDSLKGVAVFERQAAKRQPIAEKARADFLKAEAALKAALAPAKKAG